MTDDLVKRMRAVPRDYDLYDHDIIYEAADRIEELEAALRKIAQHDMQSIALNALVQKISNPFADTTEKTDD
jgi:hypothetical protein